MKTRNTQILMTLLAIMAAATIFSSCSKKEKMENFLLKTSWKVEEITGAPDATDRMKDVVGAKIYFGDNHKMVIDNSANEKAPYSLTLDWLLSSDSKTIYVNVEKKFAFPINIEKQAKKIKASFDLNSLDREPFSSNEEEEEPIIVTFLLKPIK